jgi:plasmid stabilization system protein ParE
MAREVAWTEIAAADLEQTWQYIAHDSLMYAASFVQQVRDVSRSLNELSERGRIVPEIGAEDIRELVVGNFRLVYQVAPTRVFILRLIHGARRLPPVQRRPGS